MIHDKKVSVGAMYAQKKKYIDKKTNQEMQADIKDGDLVKIVGQAVEKESKFGGMDTVIMLETRNGKRAFNLNKGSTNNLIDAYGKDDANWLNQMAKVWIFKVMKDDKMQLQAFLSHPDSTIDEETGKFLNPEKGDVQIAETEDGGEIQFEGDEDDNDVPPDEVMQEAKPF